MIGYIKHNRRLTRNVSSLKRGFSQHNIVYGTCLFGRLGEYRVFFCVGHRGFETHSHIRIKFPDKTRLLSRAVRARGGGHLVARAAQGYVGRA